MAENRTTTDHEEIREWAESRGGKPARVAGQDPIALRIDFPGEQEEEEEEEVLEQISWEEFFDVFEESNLIFLYHNDAWLH